MARGASVCLLFAFISWRVSLIKSHNTNTKLLLVSFDGFRWDYLHMVKAQGRQTPNFDYLIENGVFAERGTKNVFVTKTFPNHYSLVTGMYEQNHGIVGNVMYDPRWQETFEIADPKVADSTRWWNNGTSDKYSGPEPIWITNQKGSQPLFKRRSGVMFWPGSEAEVRGMRPYHYMKYDRLLPNKTRIDNIVRWFTNEQDPINLGLLYFSEPDHLGHLVGPNSPRIIDMIVELDELVGYLISQLKNHDMFHHMNMIITSDHGMSEIRETICLNDHVDMNLVSVIVGHSPGMNVIAKKGKEEELLRQLRNVSHITVYKHDEVPDIYNYKHNVRVLQFVLAAHHGYDISVNPEGDSCPNYTEKGNHGYNNSLSEMHPFFIAHGPAFKQSYVSKKMFNSVDIYPLICKILHLEPGPHDGSLANIHHILKVDNVTWITLLLTILFAGTVTGLICVAACRLFYLNRHRRRHLVLPLNMLEGQKHLLTTDEEDIE